MVGIEVISQGIIMELQWQYDELKGRRGVPHGMEEYLMCSAR
jgi:hypothetical protein